MPEYTVQFPFPKGGVPQEDGATVTYSEQQAQFYLPDGRIAPVPTTGTLSGLIFDDTNEDGLLDVGENPWLLGLTIVITDSASNVHNVPVSTVDGTWVSPALPPGLASVNADGGSVPAGYDLSLPVGVDLPYTPTVVVGQDTPVANIGIKPAAGA